MPGWVYRRPPQILPKRPSVFPAVSGGGGTTIDPGASTAAGDASTLSSVQVTRTLTSSVFARAAATSTLAAIKAMTSVILGKASTSSALAATKNVSGTSAGKANVTGSLTTTKAVSSQSKGAARTTTAITRTVALTATAQGRGATTVSATVIRAVSAPATGKARTQSALSVTVALPASVSRGRSSTVSAASVTGGGGTVDLSSPSFAIQNTTTSNSMGADGYSWSQAFPIIVDAFGKIIIIGEDSSNNHKFTYSNDNGATWADGSISQAAITRGSAAWDSVNDKLHVLWQAEATTDGIIYRRYSITRDGSNNITDITRPETGINLQLDFDGATTGADFGTFPVMLWLNDAAYGTNGAIVAFWNASRGGKGEIRASMRVLSNTSADNTASNWVSLGASSTDSIGQAPSVAYTALQTFGTTGYSANNSGFSVSRKIASTHAKDLYLFYFDGATGVNSYKWRRLPWNSGSSNWNNTFTTPATISPSRRAGTDTGYSLKAQLITKPVEDKINDRVYISWANWKDDTAGDTVSYAYVDSSDTLSSVVDVYSAGGAHSYAPSMDIVFDQGRSVLAVSYIKTSTQNIYVQTFQGTTQHQAETAMFTASSCDIPLLWSDPNTELARFNTDKLLSVFRNTAATKVGYAGTMTWAGAAVIAPSSVSRGIARITASSCTVLKAVTGSSPSTGGRASTVSAIKVTRSLSSLAIGRGATVAVTQVTHSVISVAVGRASTVSVGTVTGGNIVQAPASTSKGQARVVSSCKVTKAVSGQVQGHAIVSQSIVSVTRLMAASTSKGQAQIQASISVSRTFTTRAAGRTFTLSSVSVTRSMQVVANGQARVITGQLQVTKQLASAVRARALLTSGVTLKQMLTSTIQGQARTVSGFSIVGPITFYPFQPRVVITEASRPVAIITEMVRPVATIAASVVPVSSLVEAPRPVATMNDVTRPIVTISEVK
jgi:hypothetical protein